MTKAERVIMEASKRASAYKYDISKYPILASGEYGKAQKKSTETESKKKS